MVPEVGVGGMVRVEPPHLSAAALAPDVRPHGVAQRPAVDVGAGHGSTNGNCTTFSTGHQVI